MFRFKTKTILILIFATCILSVAGKSFIRYREQKTAIDFVMKHGGYIQFDYQVNDDGSLTGKAYPKNVPKILVDWFGDQLFCNVHSVVLDQCTKPINSIDSLQAFDQLRHLTFQCDRSLKRSSKLLVSFPHLRTLVAPDFHNFEIPNKVSQHPIQTLSVSSLKEGDVSNIASLSQLRSLKIKSWKEKDSFDFLTNNQHLSELSVTSESTLDVHKIGKLVRLNSLELRGPIGRIDSIGRLKNLKKLIYFNRDFNQIPRLNFLESLVNLEEFRTRKLPPKRSDLPNMLPSIKRLAITEIYWGPIIGLEAFPNLEEFKTPSLVKSDFKILAGKMNLRRFSTRFESLPDFPFAELRRKLPHLICDRY